MVGVCTINFTVSLNSVSFHYALHVHVGSQPLPEPTADDLWASGSEEGDFPDAPGGIVADGGLGTGGFNLREAMAHAKLSPIKDGDGIRGQSHPDDEPMAQPRPPHQEAVDDITLSDWESEEAEVKPHPPPNIVNFVHIPVAVGASREPSTLQQNRGRGSKSGEEGESEGVSGDAAGVDNTGATAHVTGLEMPKISDKMEPGHDDKSESILSSESESDLPLFGGYNPSTPQSVTRPSLPRLPPVSQGSPQSGALIAAPLPLQSRRQGNSPSPTQTSPTLVTPLSTTGGRTHLFSTLYSSINPLYICITNYPLCTRNSCINPLLAISVLTLNLYTSNNSIKGVQDSHNSHQG